MIVLITTFQLASGSINRILDTYTDYKSCNKEFINDYGNYLLTTIDSLKLVYSPSSYGSTSRITNSYKLINFSSVYLISIEPLSTFGAPSEAIYNVFFFDTSDSSFCPFSGNTKDFSNLFLKYYEDSIDSNDVLEIIDIYINLISKDFSAYIIQDTNYVDAVFDILSPLDLEYYPAAKIAVDKIYVKEIIKPLKITNRDDVYLVDFYSWKQFHIPKFIEHWLIEISPLSLCIKNKSVYIVK